MTVPAELKTVQIERGPDHGGLPASGFRIFRLVMSNGPPVPYSLVWWPSQRK